MKNAKFGVFCLGLLVAIVTVVTSLSAHSTSPSSQASSASLMAGQDRDGRPSTRERRAMPDVLSLRAGGAQLGVMVSDPSTRQSPQADSGSLRAGVVVDEVNSDSPAEKAGIKAGDIIVEYDGERVRSARQFTRLVQETPDGRSVAIGLMRDGKKQTVNATPESGRMTWDFSREPGAGSRDPEEFFFRGIPDFNFDYNDRMPRRFEYRMPEGVFRFPTPGSRLPASRGRLGVSVQSITPELAEYFGAKNGGALVSGVTPDSAASKAGIKAGDVIVSVNGRGVRDSDDLVRELEAISSSTSLGAGGEATIVVLRDKKEMTLKASGLRRQ